jgi:hypothetical protein
MAIVYSAVSISCGPVAVTVNVCDSSVVGVPFKTPPALSDNPSGNTPTVTVQVIGRSPLAVNVKV